jgi:hypothetical protein
MKEGEQSRDYNDRVSAVWRLSRAAAMYKGALQVMLLTMIPALTASTMTITIMTSNFMLIVKQGASMLAMSGCVVMGLWYVSGPVYHFV